MLAPMNLSPDQLVAERDSFRRSLEQLIQGRRTFTETELAGLNAVGVSVDPLTKQFQWTPVNGTDAAAEWNAYHKAMLALLKVPECSWTAHDLAEMEANGVTSEQLLAEIDEMVQKHHQEGSSQ